MRNRGIGMQLLFLGWLKQLKTGIFDCFATEIIVMIKITVCQTLEKKNHIE